MKRLVKNIICVFIILLLFGTNTIMADNNDFYTQDVILSYTDESGIIYKSWFRKKNVT